jgi:hypothetical protein
MACSERCDATLISAVWHGSQRSKLAHTSHAQRTSPIGSRPQPSHTNLASPPPSLLLLAAAGTVVAGVDASARASAQMTLLAAQRTFSADTNR